MALPSRRWACGRHLAHQGRLQLAAVGVRGQRAPQPRPVEAPGRGQPGFRSGVAVPLLGAQQTAAQRAHGLALQVRVDAEDHVQAARVRLFSETLHHPLAGLLHGMPHVQPTQAFG